MQPDEGHYEDQRNHRLGQCYLSARTQTLQVPCSRDPVDDNWITSRL